MDSTNFFSLLGEMPTKSELNLKVLQELDCGTFIRQKIGYSSEVGETISAFLCIPKNISASLPAIYCFHQHAGNWSLGKSEVVGLAGLPDQVYARELAERGYITLAPDAICFEERADAADPVRYHAHQLHTRLMRGLNSAGDFYSELVSKVGEAVGVADGEPYWNAYLEQWQVWVKFGSGCKSVVCDWLVAV